MNPIVFCVLSVLFGRQSSRDRAGARRGACSGFGGIVGALAVEEESHNDGNGRGKNEDGSGFMNFM